MAGAARFWRRVAEERGQVVKGCDLPYPLRGLSEKLHAHAEYSERHATPAVLDLLTGL